MGIRHLILLLGDQLTHDIASLADATADDVVLICEVMEETTYVRHHKKKIAFLFSAMRHFAEELSAKGLRVRYVRLDDPQNAGSFGGEVGRAVAELGPQRIITVHAGEYRVHSKMETWEKRFGIPVDIREDNRFLSSLPAFRHWAQGRKNLRMEFFYREMRKAYSLLMDGGEPAGGQWNYDAENRKTLDSPGFLAPKPRFFEPDDITRDVIRLVESRFHDHFGDIDPFYFAVTRAQALMVLDDFIKHRLPLFGDYQDAMLEGEPWLYHSHLSFYLNCGLLGPLEVVRAAEAAWKEGHVPLNSAEGFIRQIIGWREYVRGIYWLKMPDYAAENHLAATRRLPWFFWSGDTDMNCLKQCIGETKRHAYAHHIQRLMVLGNFSLIAGIDPRYVNEWYLVVYADAYEWVELPNVSGMILFADGGYLASKPYAASGAYINKMSDYCKNCAYDPDVKSGPKACPYNYLYWNFMMENEDKLRGNPRLGYTYSTLGRMGPERKAEIRADSQRFFELHDMEATS